MRFQAFGAGQQLNIVFCFSQRMHIKINVAAFLDKIVY